MQVSIIKNVISSVLKEYFNDLKILVDVHEDESLTLDLTHYINVRGRKKEAILGSVRMEYSQYNPILLDGKQLFHVHSFVNMEGQGLNYGKDLYCCAINIAAREKTGIISGPIFDSTKSNDALAMTHKLMRDKSVKTQPVLAVHFEDHSGSKIVHLAKISEFEKRDIIRNMKTVESEVLLVKRSQYSEALEAVLSRQKERMFHMNNSKSVSICYVHHTDGKCNVSVPVEFIGNKSENDEKKEAFGNPEPAENMAAYAELNSMLTMKRLWVYLLRENDKLPPEDKISQKKILAIAKEINSIENSDEHEFDRARADAVIIAIKKLVKVPAFF